MTKKDKPIESKVCVECGKIYYRTYHNNKRWANTKLCSLECSHIYVGKKFKENPPTKGMKHSDEARKNMSEAHLRDDYKGKIMPQEQRDKIRKSNRETYQRRLKELGIISNSNYNLKNRKTGYYTNNSINKGELNGMYGAVPWNKGKKGVMPEPWNKGIKATREIRDKQIESWVFRRLEIEIEEDIRQYAYRYALVHAMNNVRNRDQNSCQWYGCDVSGEDNIHVHHIFLRSEYPELELIEEYMICYCIDHHAYWHKIRGDKYYNVIKYTRRKKPRNMPMGVITH